MKCFRIGFSNLLIQYLHGALNPIDTAKVEDHVSYCKSCNSKLNRLMEGNALAKQIPSIQSKQDGWSKFQTALLNDPPVPPRRTFVQGRSAVAIIILAVVSIFLWQAARIASPRYSSIPTDEFRQVPISEMPANTEPHVVTEGYISEVRTDGEDGDLVFKLVESLEEPSPFIICEIIPPFRLNPPEVGNKVRVYGVSRFDPKENHQWYEVHPVMEIEKVE
jgi:hypothetical protein